jgi:biotin carboxyl carrier protein
VTAVLVKAGDTVAAGQIVLKLEAMKMENDIATPAAGTVKAVHISQGSEVSSGQLLVEVG